MSKASKIKEALKPNPINNSPVLLSTGSALFDLALSGSIEGGLQIGKYYLWVGDSQSGKSFLGLTTLAEATLNNHFDKYDLIYDNVEDGALMDRQVCFGKRLTERLREVSSSTIEDFYFRLDDLIQEEKQFIYVLDSMDGLTTEDDNEQFSKAKAAHAKAKSATGSYGTSKSKANSSGLRTVVNKIKESGSILIIICQTRDNIGFGSQFNPKTRSGGRALKFYATNEAWFSIKNQIAPNIKGKPRNIGNLLKIQVKKNRQTGWQPVIELPIYHGTGVDDLGSCVSYLIDEKHWKGTQADVKAPEFDFDGSIEDLIRYIESSNLRSDLHSLVKEVWDWIQDNCRMQRVNRYGAETDR